MRFGFRASDFEFSCFYYINVRHKKQIMMKS